MDMTGSLPHRLGAWKNLQSLVDVNAHVGRPTCTPDMRPYTLGQIVLKGERQLDSHGIGMTIGTDGLLRDEMEWTDDLESGLGSDRGDQGPQSLPSREWDSAGMEDEEHDLERGASVQQRLQELRESEGKEMDRRHSAPHSRHWRRDPRRIYEGWSALRPRVHRLSMRGEPIRILGTGRGRSERRSAMRSPLSLSRLPSLTRRTDHWIRGRLTNFQQLREMMVKYRAMPSHEIQETVHLRVSTHLKPVEGLLVRGQRPSRMIFLNPMDHRVAIREAHSMGIPIAAVMNTDFPESHRIDYKLPGNDRGLEAQRRYLGWLESAMVRGREGKGDYEGQR